MTIKSQVSGRRASQVQNNLFIPRDYQIFAGLDVGKHSMVHFRRAHAPRDPRKLRYSNSKYAS
jgi:hypothetical protein